MAIYVHMLSHAAESIRTAEHRLEGSFIIWKNKTMKRSMLIFFPCECEVLEKSDIFSAGTNYQGNLEMSGRETDTIKYSSFIAVVVGATY